MDSQEDYYKAPTADLEETQSNPLAKWDYHDLKPLIDGRKMILALCGFYLVIGVSNIWVAIDRSIEDYGQLPIPIIIFLAVLLALIVGIIVSLYSSSKTGFYFGLIGAALSMLIFPIGTAFGFFGIKGLLRTKSIYLDRNLNFKLLDEAFLPYR